MKTLLVAVDLSEVTPGVVATASELATALGATVHLLHAVAPEPAFVGFDAGPPVVRDQEADAIHAERSAVDALAEGLRTGGLEVHAHVVQDATVDAILGEAERRDADLIVVGSHGHGALYRALVGSVSEGVLRATDRPVLVVPGRRDREA